MKSKNRSFSAIGKLVKKYRLQHSDKVSQGELSSLLGYKNGQFISNVERGMCSVPLKSLKNLSNILSIPEHEVISSMLKDYEDTMLNYMKDKPAF